MPTEARRISTPLFVEARKVMAFGELENSADHAMIATIAPPAIELSGKGMD